MSPSRLAPILVIVAALLVPAPIARAGSKPKTLDPALFSDAKSISKEARKFFDDEDLEKIQKKKYTKLYISEFAVEFVTQETKKGSGSALQLLGVGKSELEFDEGFRKALPAQLYDALVKEITALGYTIVPKQDVVTNPLYAKFIGTEDAASGRGQSGASKGAYQKMLIYPPDGMKVLELKGDAEDENQAVEAELAHALDVPMAMRLHVKVGIYAKQQPAIESGSLLVLSIDPKTKTAKKTGKVTWEFDRDEKAEMKDGLRVEVNVVAEKNFESGHGSVLTIDTAKFQDSLNQLYPPFCKMIGALLSPEL